MKFKYLNEASEFDLYPVVKDVAKLGKLFQKDGEIEWENSQGERFVSYHDGTLHRYTKYPYELYREIPDEDEFDQQLVKNSTKYTLHFPDGLKEPKA